MSYLKLTQRRNKTLIRIFIKSFYQQFTSQPPLTLSPHTQKSLQQISQQLVQDLKILEIPYRDFTIYKNIVREAGKKLGQTLLNEKSNETDLTNNWTAVIDEYEQTNGWGLKHQTITMWPFVWAVFQSWILVKIMLLHFGMVESAEMPLLNKIAVGFGILLTLCSLALLIVRNYTKFEDYEEQQMRLSKATPPSKSSFDP